jgi:hypothetical protein
MRETRKTKWGIGSFVAERKMVMGDAAEDGYTGVRVTRYGGPHITAQGRVSALLPLVTAHQMQ